MNPTRVSLTVNGHRYLLEASTGKTLLNVLRDDVGLTGTKDGCAEGECGACTVLLDGESVNACLVLADQAHGRQVITIEALAQGDELHPLQRHFVESGAVQCGFCTPGLIMSSLALLANNPQPSDQEIRRALVGNLCRCTGYVTIVEAVRGAAIELAHD